MPSSTATWKRPAWATPRPPSTTPRSLYPSPTPLPAYHLLLPLASSGEVLDQGRLSPQPPPSQRTIPGPSRPSRRPFFEQCRNASLEEEKQRERWTRVFRCVENEFCVGRVIYIQQLYIHIYIHIWKKDGAPTMPFQRFRLRDGLFWIISLAWRGWGWRNGREREDHRGGSGIRHVEVRWEKVGRHVLTWKPHVVKLKGSRPHRHPSERPPISLQGPCHFTPLSSHLPRHPPRSASPSSPFADCGHSTTQIRSTTDNRKIRGAMHLSPRNSVRRLKYEVGSDVMPIWSSFQFFWFLRLYPIEFHMARGPDHHTSRNMNLEMAWENYGRCSGTSGRVVASAKALPTMKFWSD